jgi:hypothetical protein
VHSNRKQDDVYRRRHQATSLPTIASAPAAANPPKPAGVRGRFGWIDRDQSSATPLSRRAPRPAVWIGMRPYTAASRERRRRAGRAPIEPESGGGIKQYRRQRHRVMRKQVQIDRMTDAALRYRKADREPQTPNRRTFAAGSDRSRSQERDATVTPRRYIPLCGWPSPDET